MPPSSRCGIEVPIPKLDPHDSRRHALLGNGLRAQQDAQQQNRATKQQVWAPAKDMPKVCCVRGPPLQCAWIVGSCQAGFGFHFQKAPLEMLRDYTGDRHTTSGGRRRRRRGRRRSGSWKLRSRGCRRSGRRPTRRRRRSGWATSASRAPAPVKTRRSRRRCRDTHISARRCVFGQLRLQDLECEISAREGWPARASE